jgi:hypothetical protein
LASLAEIWFKFPGKDLAGVDDDSSEDCDEERDDGCVCRVSGDEDADRTRLLTQELGLLVEGVVGSDDAFEALPEVPLPGNWCREEFSCGILMADVLW